MERFDSADSVEQKIVGAKEKIANGHFEEAHLLLEEVLAVEPTNWIALTENGLLYFVNGEYEPAMMYLESARQVQDSETLQLACGESFLRLGLTTDAVDVLTLTLDKNPLHLKARNLIGTALNQLDQPVDAIVHAEVVLHVEPSNILARCIKSVSMCQLGLHTEALALFKAAKEQLAEGAKLDALVLFQFAEALYKLNLLEESLLHLEHLLLADAEHIEALMLKSNVLEDMGKMEEADRVMELITRLTEHLPEPDL